METNERDKTRRWMKHYRAFVVTEEKERILGHTSTRWSADSNVKIQMVILIRYTREHLSEKATRKAEKRVV